MNQKELRKENEQKIFKRNIKIEHFGEIEEKLAFNLKDSFQITV